LNGKLKEKNLLTDFKITRGTVTTIDAAMIGPHGVSNPLVPLNELITTGTVFIDAEFLFQHLISQPDLCPFFCGSSGPFPAEGSWTGGHWLIMRDGQLRTVQAPTLRPAAEQWCPKVLNID
jgi:hypothetical protein